MYRKIVFPVLVLIFFLSACGSQPYLKENSAFIVFKTPTFKYADMGFVYENNSEVKAEIYGSGQAIMSLRISGDSVCMSLFACMSRKKFNQQILNAAYPDTILEYIFRGKPLFSGKNLKKTRNGFTQNIVNQNKYNIHYSVLNNEIIFRDTINKILIKVKKQ
ncbi:MAG TPA: hypothetical protein ENJ71_00475 [Epsilonproteobacteria bacterium]|nr:hypothetical protein [Campylobacterota bacterium]